MVYVAVLVKEGDVADMMAIVKSGQCRLVRQIIIPPSAVTDAAAVKQQVTTLQQLRALQITGGVV